MAKTLANMHDLMHDFLNRSDLTDAQMTELLNQAMHTIERGQFIFGDRTVHHNFQGMQKRQYTSTDEQYITVPDSIKEFEWVKIDDTANTGRFYDLGQLTPSLALSLYPHDDNVTQRPKNFALFQAQGEVGVFPYPDTTYKYDMCFYAFTADLADDADTNWWTTNAYEVLLYGALALAKVFLPDDPRIATWETLYKDAAWKLIQEEQSENMSGGPLVIRSYMPPQLCGGESFDIDVIK